MAPPLTGGLSPIFARFAGTTGAMGLDPMVLAALSTPAGIQKATAALTAATANPQGLEITPEQEAKLFVILAQLHQKGALVPVLTQVADQAEAAGSLPPGISPEKKTALVHQLAGMIGAEVGGRGLGSGGAADRFESWDAASTKLLARVRDTAVPPAGPGTPSAFLNPTFVKEFEALAGAPFTDGGKVTPLVDGPASFAVRDQLIDNAKTSIHMMTWAFYDDETGADTAKRLIAAHARGVDVKIVVDGNVARQHGHDATLKLLEDAGITVVRWTDVNRPHDGQHRKFMIVDGEKAVGGGINVGDFYSHKGPADGQKWRDTDVLLEGAPVTDAHRLFARVYNGQVDMHGLTSPKVTVGATLPPAGFARVATIDDTPGPNGTSSILLATLKAIEGATEQIDIENAYFISTPALKQALLAALERGVQVRILTNSGESVDEPIVSGPILASLPELIAAGALVYLKQGDTLHSKLMVVDGVYSTVGSYNLHPRSERYEGEVTFSSLSTDLAENLHGVFERDIAVAKRIAQASDISVPVTPLSIIAGRFFFDQL